MDDVRSTLHVQSLPTFNMTAAILVPSASVCLNLKNRESTVPRTCVREGLGVKREDLLSLLLSIVIHSWTTHSTHKNREMYLGVPLGYWLQRYRVRSFYPCSFRFIEPVPVSILYHLGPKFGSGGRMVWHNARRIWIQAPENPSTLPFCHRISTKRLIDRRVVRKL